MESVQINGASSLIPEAEHVERDKNPRLLNGGTWSVVSAVTHEVGDRSILDAVQLVVVSSVALAVAANGTGPANRVLCAICDLHQTDERLFDSPTSGILGNDRPRRIAAASPTPSRD